MTSVEEHDVLILGGGVCGLAAATQLGAHAVVLERHDRPGGLVRAHRLGDWWFDDVLHLLYFWDDETARLVKGLLGSHLVDCRPEAWVQTPYGVTRYPFQMHLGSLPRELVSRCIADIEAAATCTADGLPAAHFADVLERGYGKAICEAFLFPYNRKLWKRPLESLAPTDFQWNIPRPDLEEVRRGARDPHRHWVTYNAQGHYPRPDDASRVRGMEVLSRALANRVADLRTDHNIVGIDLARKTVHVRHQGVDRALRWRVACITTLPLPTMLQLCDEETREFEGLTWNRVLMVDVAVLGRRPSDTGHWCYYSDESIAFNRLIFMHEFDTRMAPADGWGLMAEVTERAEEPLGDLHDKIRRCIDDARGVGVLRDEDEVAHARARVIDPAYVAFTRTAAPVILRARAYLRDHSVTPLGRYGRWEYSSMAQVMRDGFSCGRGIADRLGFRAPEDLCWSANPRSVSEP